MTKFIPATAPAPVPCLMLCEAEEGWAGSGWLLLGWEEAATSQSLIWGSCA